MPKALHKSNLDESLEQDHQAIDPWYWAVTNKIQLVGGPFCFVDHDFQQEVMLNMATERLMVVRKATQMLFSESAVITVIRMLSTGRWPKGCLYLFPTIDAVTDFSASRFNPLIRDNPETIRPYVRDTNRANLKRIGSGYLYFRSGRLGQEVGGQAKTSVGLISVPADHAVMDEYDLMSQRIDEFVDGRLAFSPIKSKLWLSNPTLPDFGISAKFNLSDQRYWHVRCEACNEWTCFDDEDIDPDVLFNEYFRQVNSHVIRACKKCGREVVPKNGEWVPKSRDNEMVGYTIGHPSAAWIVPGQLREEWFKSLDRANFIRLKLGRPYIEAENRLSIAEVLSCCGWSGILAESKGPCFMGVDQGGGERDLFHVVISRRHMVQAGEYVHMGIYKGWDELDSLMDRFHVLRCVIDGLPNTDAARAFAKRFPRRVFLSFFNEHQKGAFKWDEEQYHVVSNRTEALDSSHKEIQGQRIILPRRSDLVESFADHCNAIAKKLEEDEETGSKRYVYIRLRPKDHFRFANCYESMARNGAPNLLFPEALG